MAYRNKRVETVLLALLLLLSSTSSVQSQQPSAALESKFNLSVQVTDIQHKNGKLLISIYNKSDGFPKEPQKALMTEKVDPNQPSYTFKNLRGGKYAVVIIHDLNNNGKLDKTFVGTPKEPVGLSNYSKIGLSNPPTFNKALITLDASASLKIKLNSF
ncbi:MAG: DUF2141 domain-containing protein [Planctomycetaceae bacterium]|nr:DUF2141 domain-containing protein [Planctomycetaceae bacterium]MCA9039029.1 DUF2141 domain-containing protein [Planctomycetaceae bacterium]